jgi:phosphoadenosine phosphosulfate reductase
VKSEENQNLFQELVTHLNYREKVERSRELIRSAWEGHGKGFIIAHSLGKDSSVVWHMAKEIDQKIKGFIVTTRFKPVPTRAYMAKVMLDYPELALYKSDVEISKRLYNTDPDECCRVLKVEPTRQALKELRATCWATGLRMTEGHTRTDFEELERKEDGLVKLNPILIWTEREVWQYLALNNIRVNPIYKMGYRSIGCTPCSRPACEGDSERTGRWHGTPKEGGECGIHTRRLK